MTKNSKTAGKVTRRGKRIQEERAPKYRENDKKTLLVRGGKTNELVSLALRELFVLKKPDATYLRRRNPLHPFEDEQPIIKFVQKFDTSLFVFGSNSKKRPNSLVFGRTHDAALLDMVELRVVDFRPSDEFAVPKSVVGAKPLLVFSGAEWTADGGMRRIANLLVDWFRGTTVDKVRFQGLETVISFTSGAGGKIYMRVYRTALKKALEPSVPRVELVEQGPRFTFVATPERRKLASDELFKAASKQPKELKTKMRKNTSEDVFGSKLGRVHVGKQNVDAIQTRKVRALSTLKTKKGKAAAAAAAQSNDDDAMEED